MPFSQFTTATLENGTVTVSGPLAFSQVEKEAQLTVTCLHFLLIQGDEFLSGTGNADGAGNWDGEVTPAHNLQPGPLQAVGVAVFITPGEHPRYETYTWSDQLELT